MRSASPFRWLVMAIAAICVDISIRRMCHAFGRPGTQKYMANVPSTR